MYSDKIKKSTNKAKSICLLNKWARQLEIPHTVEQL